MVKGERKWVSIGSAQKCRKFETHEYTSTKASTFVLLYITRSRQRNKLKRFCFNFDGFSQDCEKRQLAS
jgi:hypothetical protein